MTQIRQAGLAGAVFVVLLGVALALPGAPPKTSDSTTHLLGVLQDRRELFLAGQYLAGLAAVAFLLFAGGFHAYLGGGNAEARIWATSAVLAGTLAVVLVLTGAEFFTGLALTAATHADGTLVRALNDIGTGVITLSKFGYAVLLGAGSAAGRRSGVLPRWLVQFGYVGATYTAFTAVSLATDNRTLEAGGFVDLSGVVPPVVWLLSVSVLMARSRSAVGAA